MKPINSEVEKKVKEIIGDSEGEAMLKIYEWLKKNNCYKHYYSCPPRCGKTVISQLEQERRKKMNCSDRSNK